jgi:hypothetical protein
VLHWDRSDPGQGVTTEETIDMLKPLLSAETLAVLQVLGFNFKQAIGEPLTVLLRELILRQVAPQEVEGLKTLEALRMAMDPEASARFQQMWGRGA